MKRGVAICCVAVTVVAAAYIFLGRFLGWASGTYLRAEVGPKLEHLHEIDLKYTRSADESVLGPRSRSGSLATAPTRKKLLILVYYVPYEQSLTGVQSSGIEVVNVSRIDMARACEPPYRGYIVEIRGFATPEGKPRVWISGREIDLVHGEHDPDIYENLGARGRLYDASRDNVAPGGRLPDSSLSQTYLPTHGEYVSAASATGRPLFEKAFYVNGLWLGTYAVWWTKAERDAAAIVKQ